MSSAASRGDGGSCRSARPPPRRLPAGLSGHLSLGDLATALGLRTAAVREQWVVDR